MQIFIGADHRGYALKEEIIKMLKASGHKVADAGTFSDEPPCDYPAISYRVAREVVTTKGSRGILVCMTGIGHSIAANKVPGAYAALCYSKTAAMLSREHNNSNILVLGARFMKKGELREIIFTWLKTKFAAGRHLRRFRQIQALEKNMKMTFR
jgi:RpiB/LacA/LacB family sugar-phosphate isomerase